MQSLYGAIANTNKKEIMAVSIDRVYQKVLAFANKEQRGYITPQEFNLFADQAQMEIFEQYFYDMNQLERIPGSKTSLADTITNLHQKINAFYVINWTDAAANLTSIYGDINLWEEVPDLYRLDEVKGYYKTASGASDPVFLTRTCEYIQNEKQRNVYERSKLAGPSKYHPIYISYHHPSQQGNVIPHRVRIWPHPDPSKDKVTFTYIRKPIKPNWNYVVVNNKPLYNATSSTDFELHMSEESELVYRILTYTGVAIEKPQLTQIAMGLEAAKVQQEKQ